MDICPNCFEKLEESRLLYELYFYEGYSLNMITDKVAGGNDIVKIIAKERDDILYERYLDETVHYHIGRDDGYTIEAFREIISRISKDYLEARERAREYLEGASREDAKQKLTQSGLAVLVRGSIPLGVTKKALESRLFLFSIFRSMVRHIFSLYIMNAETLK